MCLTTIRSVSRSVHFQHEAPHAVYRRIISPSCEHLDFAQICVKILPALVQFSARVILKTTKKLVQTKDVFPIRAETFRRPKRRDVPAVP